MQTKCIRQQIETRRLRNSDALSHLVQGALDLTMLKLQLDEHKFQGSCTTWGLQLATSEQDSDPVLPGALKIATLLNETKGALQRRKHSNCHSGGIDSRCKYLTPPVTAISTRPRQRASQASKRILLQARNSKTQRKNPYQLSCGSSFASFAGQQLACLTPRRLKPLLLPEHLPKCTGKRVNPFGLPTWQSLE